jgi:hypothetical protein
MCRAVVYRQLPMIISANHLVRIEPERTDDILLLGVRSGEGVDIKLALS